MGWDAGVLSESAFSPQGSAPSLTGPTGMPKLAGGDRLFLKDPAEAATYFA